MVSVNREDKIQLIKDDLSKGSLDNLLLTLETYHNGDVRRPIHDLWPQFHKEYSQHGLRNVTRKDLVCHFLKKTRWEAYPQPIGGMNK